MRMTAYICGPQADRLFDIRSLELVTNQYLRGLISSLKNKNLTYLGGL